MIAEAAQKAAPRTQNRHTKIGESTQISLKPEALLNDDVKNEIKDKVKWETNGSLWNNDPKWKIMNHTDKIFLSKWSGRLVVPAIVKWK